MQPIPIDMAMPLAQQDTSTNHSTSTTGQL